MLEVGLRANRATEAGYSKATGKDKEVYNTTEWVVLLISMKKTLVLYKAGHLVAAQLYSSLG